jgi:hypothetical protein
MFLPIVLGLALIGAVAVLVVRRRYLQPSAA